MSYALDDLQFFLAVAVPIPISVIEVVGIYAVNKAGFGVALFMLAALVDGGLGAGGELHVVADGECEGGNRRWGSRPRIGQRLEGRVLPRRPLEGLFDLNSLLLRHLTQRAWCG